MTTETAPFYPENSPEAPKSSGLKDFSLDKSDNASKYDLEKMSQSELLALHSKIEARITGKRLSEVNLEQELLLQYQKAKVLQEDANKPNADVPMNQRAQVQNSLGNLLERLGKMQIELYSSEALKRLKAAVIKVVKAQPKEFQAAFFELLDQEAAAVEQELAE